MPERLRTTVREFVRTMHNPYDLDDLLDRLLSHANSALGCAGAAIMLVDDRGRPAITNAERARSNTAAAEGVGTSKRGIA